MTNTTNEKNNSLNFPFPIYNPELKYKYLASLNEKTARNYARILGYVSKFEEALGKDISQFTFEELEKVMYGFESGHKNTVETYIRIISAYLNWCVEQGTIEKNPLSELTSDDFVKYVVN